MKKSLAEAAEDWENLLLSEKLTILRRIRKDAGLTLAEVANRANLSIPYLSELERGKYPTVRMETLAKIADACGYYLRVEIINAKANTFYWIL